MKIISLIKTCSACPTQFSGLTEDNKDVYIRFRYGHLTISVNGETIYNEQVSDELDGVIDLDRIKELTKKLNIEWC
jgi:hypothetical protein